uniref:Uncharacterized protein n=1 Tax=Arundo donax TaxID=35708 RepID=A0A0A9BIZ1_ARUDO
MVAAKIFSRFNFSGSQPLHRITFPE